MNTLVTTSNSRMTVHIPVEDPEISRTLNEHACHNDELSTHACHYDELSKHACHYDELSTHARHNDKLQNDSSYSSMKTRRSQEL